MLSGLPFLGCGEAVVLNLPSPILMLCVLPEVSWVGVHGVSPICRIRFHLRISRGIKAGLVDFFLCMAFTSLGGAFFPCTCSYSIVAYLIGYFAWFGFCLRCVGAPDDPPGELFPGAPLLQIR